MKKTRAIEFLLKPPLRFCVSVWVTALAFVSASVALYFVGLGGEPWAISVYVPALIFTLFSIYLILAALGVPLGAKNVRYVRRFFDDWTFRSYVYASISVVFNVCYVVFGVLVAALERSAWLGALVGYHVFLAAARVVVMYSVWRKKTCDETYRLRVYSMCGIVLVLLALAVTPVIRLVMTDGNSYKYIVGTVTYVSAIALYTFVKLGIALRNMRKAHKLDDKSIVAVKNICFADALISLFALQAAMIKELGGGVKFGHVLNPLLGGAVAAVIFGMGVHMFVKGLKSLKALPKCDIDGADGAIDKTERSENDRP